MIRIEMGNSYSRITGMTAKQEKYLIKALSYIIGGSAAYFSGYGIRKKSLLNKRGEFPTGLWRRVMGAIKEPVSVTDRRIIPNGNRVIWADYHGISAYKWQKEAVEKAFKAGRGTISACTGSGKSIVIALIASRLNVDTLVVVPTLEIKKQILETILSVLGKDHKCTVENIDSSSLVSSSKKYGCLIIDEAHHAAAKTYQKLNKTMWKDIYYRFFLTATPFRNDTEETLLFEAIAGDVIYQLGYKAAVKENYIVPVEAYYIELPKKDTDAYTWQEVYKELVVANEHRNDIIRRILSTLALGRHSTLCTVKEVQHGKNIDYPNFVHGQDEYSRILIQRFNEAEIYGLIGTTGIIGEGVDTRPCEYVIIAGLGKAKSQFMQQIGRAVRKYRDKKSAKIIIFRDPSHKYLLRHFKSQCKVLKEEYGVKPVKLEI